MSETAKTNKRLPIKAGDFAPDFVLGADDGSSIRLSKLRGQNVIIYFYPKDDTPGCTQEAKDFSSLQEEFSAHDTVIIGISKDDQDSHQKFKQKYCIPFTLVSDLDAMVCEAYDCWVEKNMYGKKYMGVQRSTFLIDKAGRIRKLWHGVKVEGHAEEVLQEVRELN